VRVFVKYNRDGQILSVCKVEVMPEEVDTPFGPLPEGEAVLEAPAGGEWERLEPLDVHAKYRVDVRRKRLVKRP
jgi:hypothetical protein